MQAALYIICVFLFCACSTSPNKPTHQPQLSASPPTGPSEEYMDTAREYISSNLPFPVEIDPFGAIFDSSLEESELVNLKRNFLQPIATSSHSNRIQKIVIDASALEWSQWTCRIELKDFTLNPITLTHFSGLYNGSSNSDRDAYIASRSYVLSQLDHIARRTGWQ